MKYIEPELNKDSFTCEFCKTLSLHKWGGFVFPEDGRPFGMIESRVDISRCVSCGEKSIWIDGVYVYPSVSTPEPDPNMPPTVLELYNEAGEIYGKSPRAACALLRLAVERLCNELGETDRDINKNIANLVKNGLPIKVQQAFDIVRVVGNKAVHPGQIEFDVDDIGTAKMLFYLLNISVASMISEQKEIDALFEALPESVKSAVGKRDM